ncbi:hypothetical protein AZ20_2306 [Bordetella bronchiseptica E014]|uniref:SRPBCC family protein n=1 Tax=Bordetella bronchiseptica TaxID=518 RepID=UPI00045AFC05|nr:SRPBCC family protein [Bordetella bronchiseptica]KAK72297.1 hypothetical protein L530_2328 [Bordetella bronchiseptica MO211]KDC20260.1 hypothetical protein AZ20_2306 [Bordetella bronchiseptica E014]KDD39283.1 hypothetical protein L529_2367 [Bordetella bronchiseptica MBORD901]
MTFPSSASPDGHGARLDAQSIRFERLLPGPIERVWAWLADADKRARWLAGGELPRQPGQTFELHFHHAALTAETAPARYAQYDRPIVAHHTLLRCEPPRVLALTWGGGAGEAPSEVLFELSEAGEQVRLVLTHTRLADRAAMLDVAGGWHAHLAVLAGKLAGQAPPPFWTTLAQAEQDYEQRL